MSFRITRKAEVPENGMVPESQKDEDQQCFKFE
jgi:hypothetical protein